MKNRMMSLFFAFVLFSAFAFAASPKISRDLQKADMTSSADVIVVFNETPTARHHEMVTSRGGVLKEAFPLVQSGHYSIPVSALEDLAAQPEVAFIAPNRKVKAMDDNSNEAVNALAAWGRGD